MATVFDVTAVARFDNVTGGTWQRVYDFSNGGNTDEVYLASMSTSRTMRFEVMQDGHSYVLDVPNAITNGETATWRTTISDTGTYTLYKNGAVIAQQNFGPAAVLKDVARDEIRVGSSPWGGDTPLIGEVSSITVTSTLTNKIDPNTTDGITTFQGTSGADYIDAAHLTQNVSIEGGAGNDTIYGGSGADTIYYGEGNNTVYAGAGNDVIDDVNGSHLLGTDYIDAGAGNDTVWSGFGNDTLIGGDGNDSLFGEEDNDSIDGGTGNDWLQGDAGADTIRGGTGADIILGGTGDDVLYGDDGNDIIAGGDGNDWIQGGAGADTIYLATGGGADTVSDFNAAEDKLNLSYLTDVGNATTNQDSVVTANEIVVTGGGGSPQILTFPGGETVQVPDGTIDTSSRATTFNSLVNIGVPPCFATGTLILTPEGQRPVESLRPGDRVITADHGPQPVAWIGCRVVDFREPRTAEEHARHRPVVIARGALGRGLPARDLKLSPQHRVLVTGERIARTCGAPEVLVNAKSLLALPGVQVDAACSKVAYFALLFARHEVILAEGLMTESFRPGPVVMAGFAPRHRAQIAAIYPGIEEAPEATLGAPARTLALPRKIRKLAASRGASILGAGLHMAAE